MTAPRVAFLASHLTPRLGLERAVETLVAALADEVRITLVLVAEGDADHAFVRPDVATQRLGPSRRNAGRLLTVARIRRWLRSTDCDVVVGCGVWVAVPLLLAALGRRSPAIVVWEHSLDGGKLASDRGLRVLRRAAWLLYPRAEAVVCVSQTLATQLADVMPRARLTTISNITAVRSRVAQSRTSPDSGHLLSIGSLTRTKNHQLAIRALAHLAGARLTIAGQGPLRPRLADLAVELGIADRVDFAGYVDDPSALFEACDVVVHPSLGETFGYVLFEAAEFQRAVVVLDSPLARELVPVSIPGRIACRPTPEAYAEAIRLAMATTPTQQEWEQARRRRQSAASADAVTRQWLNLFGALARPSALGNG